MRTVIDAPGKLLVFSIIGSIGLTLLGLLNYSPNISPLLWLAQSARGYPFHFLINTYWTLMPMSAPLGYHIIIPALLADLLVWLLVSFVVLFVVRQVMHAIN